MKKYIDIPGIEHYQINEDGDVKVLARTSPTGRNMKERDIKSHINKKGYRFVNITLHDGYTVIGVHRLLAAAFLNHPVYGSPLVVDHIDNNPQNNKLSNLQVITHRKNASKDKIITTGYLGVKKEKRTSKPRWTAQIRIDGKHVHLGTYDTPELASEAYQTKLKSI